MKHFGTLCILLILVHFSIQITKYENCPESIMKSNNHCDCCKVTCYNSEGTEIGMLACPLARCRPGTQIGYQEDKTKVYPDCCGRPICRN